MANWGKVITREYIETGEFVKALVGIKKDSVGEIVYHHNWGGVDVKFEDEVIVTYANDDIELVLNK